VTGDDCHHIDSGRVLVLRLNALILFQRCVLDLWLYRLLHGQFLLIC
jgi:hypothetical protein